MSSRGDDDALEAVDQAWRRLATARAAVDGRQLDLQGAVRAAIDAGVPASVLAERMGVTASRVRQLRRGR